MSLDLFAAFPPVGKQEWLDQIQKDLKGKPLDSLEWLVNERVAISPLVRGEDFSTPPSPMRATPGAWEICEDIAGEAHASARAQALEALQGGAEGLCFEPLHTDTRSISALLEGIYLDYVGLHFKGAKLRENPGALLAVLSRLAEERGIPTEQLRGSLHYDPLNDAVLKDWRYLADLLQFAQSSFPGFRIITVDGSDLFQDARNIDADLAALLQRGARYISQLHEKGAPAAQTAAQMQFVMPLGNAYFLSVAALRAFRLMWYNLLKGWGLAPAEPYVAARCAPGAYTDDLYANMIRGTTIAMSAVVGGAQRLTIAPYDTGREDQAVYSRAFARRIARNVQHLLKTESFFDQAVDPAAGSYYIERMTENIAQSAWKLAF